MEKMCNLRKLLSGSMCEGGRGGNGETWQKSFIIKLWDVQSIINKKVAKNFIIFYIKEGGK